MARKSRKTAKNQIPDIAEPSMRKSRAGIYARLSVEDNGDASNDSIQNQVAYLEEYIKKRGEDFQLVRTYVDNGMTGTNFDRDGWRRLLDDLKSGNINCIIVKDFSRIGRNYIEVGNYLEKIFPFLGVRLVSVNDNFDSKKQPFENNMLMNSLMNIVNDYYAKDISRKVLQTRKAMQENGEYASGVYPYGYKGAASNRRKLSVDSEAADVVKKIFQWRTQGKSCSKIALYLNELAIPSPGLYRLMNGEQAFKSSRNSKWRVEHISKILTNPVYLGHLVQGKKQASHFKNNGKTRRMPKEKWVISENTHEPLVAWEHFNIAADMAKESHQKYCERMAANADIPQTENPLRKKIYCGHCGHRMLRRSKVTKDRRNYYYYCDTQRRLLHGKCVQASIQEKPLMETAKEVTGRQLQLYGILLGQWDSQNANKTAVQNGHHELRTENSQWEHQKRALGQEITLIKKRRQELYEDMKDGLLSHEDFMREREQLAEKRLRYKEELRCMKRDKQAEEEALESLRKCQNKVVGLDRDEMPLDILDILIERIVVLSPEQIDITFAYADMMVPLV